MKHIRNYSSYKQKRLVKEDFNKKVMILSDVELSGSDEVVFKNIFENLLSKVTDVTIQSEINRYIIKEELLNEGFFDKLKERFPKAAKVSNILSDKAESTLRTILQKATDAVSFIKKIIDGIKDLFSKTIAKAKEFFSVQLKTGELKKKLDEVVDTNREGLVKDAKTCKTVLDFYRKLFVSKFSTLAQNGLTNFFNSEQTPVSESMINETNVIATLVHGIEKVPPFSILHQIASGAEKGINVIFDLFSQFTKSIGGPEFQLPVIAILLSLSIEYIIKNVSGHWLLELTGPSPLGMAIKGIKITATLVAAISAIDAILDSGLLAHSEHADDKHEAPEQAQSQPVNNQTTQPQPEPVKVTTN
jgi:hypothetical protein